MQLGTDSPPDLTIVPAYTLAQMAGRLTMPTSGRVLELGAYVRGVSGFHQLPYRLCLWSWDGHVGDQNRLLGRSALQTVSTASANPANLLRVTWPLESPVELQPGAQLLVGIAWDNNLDHEAYLGGYTGSGLRYRKELPTGDPFPVTMKDCEAVADHDLAAWIEDYSPLSGVWVYRSGAWKQADSVIVERGGLDTAATVKVRRSGVWTDAS